jgi:predicted nucleotidyltransferase
MVHPHLKEILTKLKRYLKQEYGEQLDQVILFGSQARGDATAESDIDILVVLLNDEVDACKEINRTGKCITDLCLEYNVMISCILTSKTIYATKQNAYFYRNIYREGIAV